MRATIRDSAVVLIMAAALLLSPSAACAVEGSAGLDTTAAEIVHAPANTVWMTYPDANASNPKPQGVGYPDPDAYAFYVLSMGVVLGMQANPQWETVDTNRDLFDAVTGQPVVSGTRFVIMAPASVHAQMAYYESNRIAPVYLYGDDSSLFWVTSANDGVILETVTSRSSLTASSDLFLLEVFSDGFSNYVFACYGLTAKGSMAAARFYQSIFQQLDAYSESWYVIQWTDTNSDGIPEPGDGYRFVASEDEYTTRPIPEFSRMEAVTILSAVSLVMTCLFVRKSLPSRRARRASPLLSGSRERVGSSRSTSPPVQLKAYAQARF